MLSVIFDFKYLTLDKMLQLDIDEAALLLPMFLEKP